MCSCRAIGDVLDACAAQVRRKPVFYFGGHGEILATFIRLRVLDVTRDRTSCFIDESTMQMEDTAFELSCCHIVALSHLGVWRLSCICRRDSWSR